MTTYRPRAFSLIEVLVVCAIIAILIALVGVGVRNAVLRAKASADTSNLRQIGQALELYISEKDGLGPRQLDEMVVSQHLPSQLLAGSCDPTQSGYANIFRQSPNGRYFGRKPVPYKFSYITKLDASEGLQQSEADATASRRGWLIGATHGKQVTPANFLPVHWQGSYLRLCNDGSVVSRQFLWRWITVGGRQQFALSVNAAYEDR